MERLRCCHSLTGVDCRHKLVLGVLVRIEEITEHHLHNKKCGTTLRARIAPTSASTIKFVLRLLRFFFLPFAFLTGRWMRNRNVLSHNRVMVGLNGLLLKFFFKKNQPTQILLRVRSSKYSGVDGLAAYSSDFISPFFADLTH